MSPEQNIQKYLIGGLCLICAALLISWWLRNFELVEEEYRTGISLEARRNPFLAAELFLREMEVDVESVSGRSRLQDLPPTTDILLVNDFGGNLSQERHDRLLQWIKAGGHIVITANRYWDEDRGTSGNNLLDGFGVHLVYAGLYADENEEDLIYQPEDTNIIVPVTFEGGAKANVAFNYLSYLEDTEEYASTTVSSEIGIHLMQINYGEGLLTVLSDNNFLKNPQSSAIAGVEFNNNAINSHDHAYFLFTLLGNSAKVWLIYNTQSPSLTTLLWQIAPHACISFLVLILFWLWSTRNRFGPRMPPIDLPRRNLLEHISVSASFEWSRDKSHTRVKHNREMIETEIKGRHPYISTLEAREKCEALEKISGLAAEKIYIALYQDWKNEREFIQLSYLLRTLRQKI